MKMPFENWGKVKRGQYTFGVPTFYSDFHVGLDLIVPVGTPIYAPTNGSVQTLYGKQGGNTIHMIDNKGHLIRFLHLSKFNKKGLIKAGDLIGLTGNTGLSTGPHCHIDISKNGRLELNNLSNFIDPEKYFMNTPIKLKILVAGKEKIGDKVLEVVQWYKDQSNNEITFAVDIEHVDNIGNIEWVGNLISNSWRSMNLASRASGYDIAVLCLPPKLWKAKEYLGFTAANKHLGVQTVCMLMDLKRKDPRFVGMSGLFSGVLRHEIAHSLHAMQGYPYNNKQDHFQNKKDNTHYLEYTEQKLEKMFDYFDRDRIKGWDENKMFRYAPSTSKTTKPDWEAENGKVYRSQDGRMFFLYEKGWHIIDEAQYNTYANNGHNKGMISVTEANWIYQQLDKLLPEDKQDTILERIAMNSLQKNWLKINGWSNNIPNNHLI